MFVFRKIKMWNDKRSITLNDCSFGINSTAARILFDLSSNGWLNGASVQHLKNDRHVFTRNFDLDQLIYILPPFSTIGQTSILRGYRKEPLRVYSFSLVVNSNNNEIEALSAGSPDNDAPSLLWLFDKQPLSLPVPPNTAKWNVPPQCKERPNICENNSKRSKIILYRNHGDQIPLFW